MSKIKKDTLKLAYDLSNMAAYAKTNGEVLIQDLVMQAQSFKPNLGYRIETGIKSTDKFADVSLGYTVLQSTNGDVSSVSASGTTGLKDISVTVTEIAIKEKYVKSTLDSKIGQVLEAPGSDYSNELPYGDILVSLKGKEVGRLNDILLWQGDSSTGNTNANTNKFNGFLTQILAGSYVDGGTKTGLTAANAIATVEAVKDKAFTAFPAWITNGCDMYMSPLNYSVYYRAVFGLGSVINDLTKNEAGLVESFMMPGTNVKVISCNGLQGQTNIVVTRDSNLVIGTDLVSEDDQFEFRYLEELEYWRLKAVYKLGATVARVAECVATH
jgi:hypothetical protein